MRFKIMALSLFLVFMFTGAIISQAQEIAETKNIETESPDPEKSILPGDSASVSDTLSQTDRYIAYYFHGTRRCATCKKIEAYSTEAVQGGFPDLLKSGNLEWNVVNIDEDENGHFVDDYKLYTKSVIVSHVLDGEEVEWKNLDKVWTLVGDRDKFIDYVRTEMRGFMEKQ